MKKIIWEKRWLHLSSLNGKALTALMKLFIICIVFSAKLVRMILELMVKSRLWFPRKTKRDTKRQEESSNFNQNQEIVTLSTTVIWGFMSMSGNKIWNCGMGPIIL